jgi:diguanylate cyclase (GGDEF)-like protein
VSPGRPPQPSPSMVAAQRHGLQQGGGRGSSPRAYPAVGIEAVHPELPAWFAATRALLRVTDPEQVPEVIATLIRDLGGRLVRARVADPATAFPIDVSFGLSEPLLACADPLSGAASGLARVLPEFVEDARIVLGRLRRDARRTDEAERDTLTGLLTRRAWMRRLSSADAGDPVSMIDLDRFKTVNDTAGHTAGDEVLRAVGALLMGTFRDNDACGRYGGDELVCLTPGMPIAVLTRRLDTMRQQWEGLRPASGAVVGLSIGVAVIRDSPRAALQAADRALYRVKNGGRNRTLIAGEGDYDSSRDT